MGAIRLDVNSGFLSLKIKTQIKKLRCQFLYEICKWKGGVLYVYVIVS